MVSLRDITLVIPAYNRPTYLERQIDFWSVTDVHLCILDGSKESAPQSLIDRMGTNVYYRHVPIGFNERLVMACDLVQTKYVALLGDDELYAPHGLKDGITQLEDDERLIACVGRTVFFFERDGAHFYNSLAMIDPKGDIMGVYRKSHIPDGPGYNEKFYFRPGNTGFRVWPTRYGVVGIGICWDQWYPEAARLTALQGAQILFYPTAIGWHPSEKAKYGERHHSSWETVQRGHAIANGCYVVAPNRIGHEAPDGGDGIEFWGQSFVADPSGQILVRGSVDQAEVLVVEVDLEVVDTQRTHWPFLRDRRIDFYGDITRRFID